MFAFSNWKPVLRLALPLALLAALTACADTSSAFNKYHQGKNLYVNVVTIQRTDELNYSTVYSSQAPPEEGPCAAPRPVLDDEEGAQGEMEEDAPDLEEGTVRHWRITPSEEEMELVLVRVKVENHNATSQLLEVDSQAAQLRDFFQGRYQPIDVGSRVQQVEESEVRDERPIAFVRGAFELLQGCGIDGWMVFEAPEGTEFREFRWRAGDSLTIEF